jgi:hypothetical protein
MSDDHRDLLVPQGADETEHVADTIEQGIRHEIVAVGHWLWSTEAVAPRIRRNDVISRLGEGKHLVAPCISQLWKAMQQDDARPARGLEPGFKDMQDPLIVGVDPAGTNPPWKRGLAIVDSGIFLRSRNGVGAGSSPGLARKEK